MIRQVIDAPMNKEVVVKNQTKEFNRYVLQTAFNKYMLHKLPDGYWAWLSITSPTRFEGEKYPKFYDAIEGALNLSSTVRVYECTDLRDFIKLLDDLMETPDEV